MEGFDIEDIARQDVATLPRDPPHVLEARAKKEAAEAKAELKAAAAKIAPKTTRALPKEKPEEDPRANALIAHKINLYRAKFSDKISCKIPASLPKTNAALKELLLEIESELQSKGGIEKADELFCAAAMGIENGTRFFNPLGWQLNGPKASLSATVRSNKSVWEDTVTEFAIANAEYFMVGPGKRLAFIMLQMVLSVDLANKAALQQKPATQETMKEAEDL